MLQSMGLQGVRHDLATERLSRYRFWSNNYVLRKGKW